MSIVHKIEITGTSEADLGRQVVALAATMQTRPAAPETKETIGYVSAVEAAPKKRGPGRPRKQDTEETVPANGLDGHASVVLPPPPGSPAEEERVEPEIVNLKAITRDELRAPAVPALQAVIAKLQMPAAKEILKRFGAERISEVKDSDIPGLVKACEAAIA